MSTERHVVFSFFPTPPLFEFDRTENRPSAIRSRRSQNPNIEPNMEWIGFIVCEIFAFKLYCDLETRVWGYLRSSKVAPFHRARTTLYSSSIVNIPLSTCSTSILPFPRYSRIFVENCYPLVFGAPVIGLEVKPSDLSNNPWWRKTRMMGLSGGERISMIGLRSAVLMQNTRLKDGRTDKRNYRVIRATA